MIPSAIMMLSSSSSASSLSFKTLLMLLLYYYCYFDYYCCCCCYYYYHYYYYYYYFLNDILWGSDFDLTMTKRKHSEPSEEDTHEAWRNCVFVSPQKSHCSMCSMPKSLLAISMLDILQWVACNGLMVFRAKKEVEMMIRLGVTRKVTMIKQSDVQ